MSESRGSPVKSNESTDSEINLGEDIRAHSKAPPRSPSKTFRSSESSKSRYVVPGMAKKKNDSRQRPQSVSNANIRKVLSKDASDKTPRHPVLEEEIKKKEEEEKHKDSSGFLHTPAWVTGVERRLLTSAHDHAGVSPMSGTVTDLAGESVVDYGHSKTTAAEKRRQERKEKNEAVLEEHVNDPIQPVAVREEPILVQYKMLTGETIQKESEGKPRLICLIKILNCMGITWSTFIPIITGIFYLCCGIYFMTQEDCSSSLQPMAIVEGVLCIIVAICRRNLCWQLRMKHFSWFEKREELILIRKGNMAKLSPEFGRHDLNIRQGFLVLFSFCRFIWQGFMSIIMEKELNHISATYDDDSKTSQCTRIHFNVCVSVVGFSWFFYLANFSTSVYRSILLCFHFLTCILGIVSLAVMWKMWLQDEPPHEYDSIAWVALGFLIYVAVVSIVAFVAAMVYSVCLDHKTEYWHEDEVVSPSSEHSTSSSSNPQAPFVI